MKIVKLTDWRKVFINPTFNEIREFAKANGWRDWNTYPVWEGDNVKLILRRTA